MHGFLKRLALCMLCMMFLNQNSFAQEEEFADEEFLFEEIDVEIPAMLVESEEIARKNVSPSVTTIITRRDIELTPARNIYDLLEIYVPGLMLMSHVESPHIGVRGINVDRNYKFLLLVNGRNMNEKWKNGADTELENWDMTDIERIEVIRGPGSVIYGPGAIQCVVNIVTRRPTEDFTEVGIQSVAKYDSNMLRISHAEVEKAYRYFLHASIAETEGLDGARSFTMDPATGQYGFVGEDFTSGAYDKPVLDFYRDHRDKPQVKFHADVDFMEDWRFWLRFTRQGSDGFQGSSYHYTTKFQFAGDDQYYNVPGSENEQLTATLENKKLISDFTTLKNIISLDSTNINRWRNIDSTVSGWDSADQGDASFYSENEINLKSILNTELGRHNLAVGVEYSHDNWNKPWGIFGSRVATRQPGFSMDTYSMFAEALANVTEKFDWLLSYRLDKNKYSQDLHSARSAFIRSLDDLGTLKLVFQLSSRMNVARRMHDGDVNQTGKSQPEEMKGVELIYETDKSKPMVFTSSFFFNDLEVIGWDGSTLSTKLIGRHKLFGTELELRYTVDKINFGINHSFVKQNSWNMSDGGTRTGISYADYAYTTSEGLYYDGEGNDLNNWSNHATKLFCNYSLSPKWTVHTDAKVFWQMEGQKDGIQMIEDAVAGTSYESSTNAALDSAEAQDAYELKFNLNFSLEYKPDEDFTLNLFVYNLLEHNNKRYGYDSGYNSAYPTRITWFEEPRTIGFKATWKM